MPRLLLVSPHLPLQARLVGESLALAPAPALASCDLTASLMPIVAHRATCWLGAVGSGAEMGLARLPARLAMEARLDARGMAAVHVGAAVRLRAQRFTQAVLWPRLHGLGEGLDGPSGEGSSTEEDAAAYRHLNERYAAAVVSHLRPGDLVWIHGAALMLVPGMVRDRVPHVTMGFFLHTPFCAAEVFRTLPQRAEFLRSLAAADLVGVHDERDGRGLLRAFHDELDRSPRVGVHPMGVDAGEVARRADGAPNRRAVQRLRETFAGQRLILSVDRMDGTGAFLRRLQAYEAFLAARPDLHGRMRFVDVVVPMREAEASGLEGAWRVAHERVGHINGRFGTLAWTPVTTLHRMPNPAEIQALYGATDVLYRAPVGDAANLVAKEFIASRVREDGVVVQSEFAGAAAELPEVLAVNPYDVAAVVRALGDALAMAPAEERQRMRRLRRRVFDLDAGRWARSFLADLLAGEPLAAPAPDASGPRLVGEVLEELRPTSCT